MNRPSHYRTSTKWHLTIRQEEIVELIAGRQTDWQIASRLGLSLDGARYHVKEILRKKGVESRRALFTA